MLTKIVLVGDLTRFCEEFHADVATPKEAIACLSANFPDFQNYILGDEDNLYRLTVSGDEWEVEITPENNLFPCRGKTITIAPVMAGSGGIGKLLTGVLLIGVGILTGGTGLIIAGALSVISNFFGNPDKPDGDEEKSLVFTSPATTVAEGNRIPIIAGKKFRVGVQIISSGIKSEFNAR